MKHDHVAAGGELVITATEFKAKCLDLLDQVNSLQLSSVTVTKRGKAVAVLRPLDTGKPRPSFYGALKGRSSIPDDVDITKPIFDGVWDEKAGVWT